MQEGTLGFAQTDLYLPKIKMPDVLEDIHLTKTAVVGL